MEEMRQQFERWWEITQHNGNPPRKGWDYWRDGDGYWSDDDFEELQSRWESWKASRAALVVSLPDKVMVEDEFDKGHNCAIDYCADAIRALGITVKGEGDLISTPDHVLDKKWHDHFGKGEGDE